ncbi:MAG: hypothetical protein IJ060_01175 [Oscillospiraceae bacterium]|nr:hypothetical protein [Oscillospiraceae bacterium]
MRPNGILRNALAVFASAGLLLTGCTASKQETAFAPQLSAAYTVQAEMTFGDSGSAALTLTRSAAEQWEAEFSDPPALAGVVLTFDGNAVSASYKGLAFTVPKSALPAKNMLSLTTEILDAIGALDEIPCAEQDDGTWVGTGESSGGSYTVTFAGSGEPVSLEIPSQPLQIQFSGYALCAADGTTAAGTDLTTTEATTSAETTNEGTSQ